jgi:REP element-mobilizing transposase RayT
MSTYTQIYYHIVFSTKYRVPCLKSEKRPELYRYIAGIIMNKKCKLSLINGVADHIHIFTSLHPTQNLSNLVKDIKLAASGWIKEERIFPSFKNWQDGYGAFTHSHKEMKSKLKYIEEQEAHHKKRSTKEELKQLLIEAGIEFDDKYLE